MAASGSFIARSIRNFANWLLAFGNRAVSAATCLPRKRRWRMPPTCCAATRERIELRRWTDVWVTEWRGVFGKRLPDGKPWIFKDFFTFEEIEVNPAIVHALASKELMVAEARKQRARETIRDRIRRKNATAPARFKPAPRTDGTVARSATGFRRQGTR